MIEPAKPAFFVAWHPGYLLVDPITCNNLKRFRPPQLDIEREIVMVTREAIEKALYLSKFPQKRKL